MEKANAYRIRSEGEESALLFDLLPDVIAVVGFDAIIRRVNPAGIAVSGFTEPELVGSDFRRLIHPEDLPLVEAAVAQLAAQGQELPIEARGVTKMGEVLWFEWHSTRIDECSFVTVGRNIAARKRVERTLSMAGAAGDVSQGFWAYDPVRQALYCSAETCGLLGFGNQAREISPQEWLSCFHPEDRERMAEEVAAAHANPACSQHLVRCRAGSGDTVRHLVMSARIRRDRDGKAVQAVGAIQDISERLSLQASLRREQELTSAIFDTTGAMMVVFDRNGIIARFNRAAELLTGWRQEEVKGNSTEMLTPPAARSGAKQMAEQLRQGKFPSSYSNAWLTRDGREVPIAWSNSALFDTGGRVEYVIATGIDISGLQRMHDELTVAREAHRRLLELSFDMVATQSVDGTILDLNGAGARMLGAQSSDELVGRNLRHIIHPDHCEAVMAAMERTFALGEQRCVAEAKLKTVDGRYRDVEIVAAAATVTWDGRRVVQSVIRDVTDRKLARAALRAREHYFESLAQVAPVGIFQSDLECCIVYANRRCVEILGCGEVTGTLWERYVHDLDRARVLGAWCGAVRERRPYSLEFRHQRPDGEMVWLRCQAIAEQDSSGEITGYIGTVSDVTSFKALTEQLLDAERRARRVADLSFDIIMLIQGDNMVISDINYPGADLMRGRNAADFVGRPLTDFFSPADHALITQDVSTALNSWTASSERECGLLRCDGSTLDAEGVTIPVIFQGEAAAYVVLRDITERKAAERALRQREHHFATLAKAAPVGIFQTDAEGRCNYANERYLEITGYPAEEIHDARWWEHVVSEDAPPVRDHWRKMVEKQGSFQLEFRLRRKDGRVIWVLGQAVAERSQAGDALGYIGSITDINQSKLDELELRNYREHLEDMVRERTLELEAVNRELESFSYSVSHDLRAPLRAINGFNSALLEEWGSKLDDDARFFLRRIQANTRQMSQLIDDLMQLSKVTQSELQREWIDLSAVAETMLGEMLLAEPERRAEFTVMPGLRAYGDPQLLRIVMQNLLGNAWKYTGQTPHTRIEFGALDVGRDRAYYVRDNGVGFDMSCVSHLFRAFQRLHDASQFEGTGVGLATVHRIVARHGGRIWAEGAEGQGATFYFVLQ